MDSANLNLTRKWRSKSFDQVIGQELSIRMLKNSLYRNQFFPVYLFSGQRGCGKTSTARIFAAAVNCQALSSFQENPKITTIPCLTCPSCVAMSTGRHPDFFEIDAASHTGVDTIRQLIDSSQLLPVMASKKIYLIDEAHMLSKASFNALLKILEEPPHSVLFILATTDVHKIIDTVRSRCFQLFFSAVGQDHIYHHLAAVCSKENIIADDQALQVIASHADGSLRDALNLLEQVRFSSGKVTKQAVLNVLGYLDDEQLVTLFEKICMASPTQLLSYIQEIRLDSYCSERVWERLVACARAALWIKHGARPQQFVQYESRIKRIVANCPWSVLSQLCERLHAEHVVFHRTTAKHALLEMILLQACYTNGTSNGTAGAAAQAMPGSIAPIQELVSPVVDVDDYEDIHDDSDDEVSSEEFPALWVRFVRDSERLGDPLLKSVFQQGKCIEYKNYQVHVEFSKQFVFFQDWLTATQDAWNPLLRAVFGQKATLKVAFTMAETPSKPVEAKQVEHISTPVVPVQATARPVASVHNQQPRQYNSHKTFSSPGKKEVIVDIAKNIQAWPLAHIVVRQFPGTITEIGEIIHV